MVPAHLNQPRRGGRQLSCAAGRPSIQAIMFDPGSLRSGEDDLRPGHADVGNSAAPLRSQVMTEGGIWTSVGRRAGRRGGTARYRRLRRAAARRCVGAPTLLVARAVGACSGIAVGRRVVVHPPVLESSLKMPPGVPPGRSIEAFWDGHRVAGGVGRGPPVYLVHGWGGQRAHLAVFVKPLVEAGYRVIAFDLPSHNESDPGALAPGRTTAIECADAIAAMIRDPRAGACGRRPLARSQLDCSGGSSRGTPVGRLVFLAPMGEFPSIWICSPPATASVAGSGRACTASRPASECSCTRRT